MAVEPSYSIKKKDLWTGVVDVQSAQDKLIPPLNALGDLKLCEDLIESYQGGNLDSWKLEFDPNAWGGPREGREYELEPMEEQKLLDMAHQTQAIRSCLLERARIA